VARRGGIEPPAQGNQPALYPAAAKAAHAGPLDGEYCLLVGRRNRNRRRAAWEASLKAILKPIRILE